MSTAPTPTWAPTEPGWVSQLAGVLSERDARVAEPSIPVDDARQIQLAAAYQWLGTRGHDAGKAITAQFSNTPELSARAHQNGGTEIPAWTVTVWGGPPSARVRLFIYTLTLDADSQSVIPRVTVRVGEGAPTTESFLPWATKSGGRLDNLTSDDLAGDFALCFSEAMAA